MLVYERLQFLIGSLLVVHQFINSHFREGELFAFTFFHLKTRNGFEYRFIILVLGIKLNKDAEGIGIIVVFGIQILIDIDGKIVFLATYIISAQLLGIGLVFRIQLYRLLHIGKCQGILFELRIEKRLIEIGFSRLRVNLPGMLKEVESCRIIAGSLLARSLQEEIVVALAVVRREMVLLNHRLLNRLHLLFTGKRRHGYRTQQDQPHCPTDISKIHLHDSNPFYLFYSIFNNLLFYTRMTVSAGSAFGFIEFINLDEIALFVLSQHHLGYTFTIVDYEILCREINEQNHDFAAIIGIDGSRRIQYGNAMLQSQTAARTDLRFITCRQSHIKTGWHQSSLNRMKHDCLIDVCPQIHAGTLRCGKRR